jgi:hypothetical protein
MTTEACWGYAAFFLATGSSMMPMMSDSFMIRSSWPSILTSVPDHLPNRTRSPAFMSMGISLPASSDDGESHGRDVFPLIHQGQLGADQVSG